MAISNGFTVTTERLDEAAQYIKEKTAQYNSNITKLYSELEAMTSNQWKGVASDAFRSKIESYREEFNQMKSILDQYAENMLTKSKNYVNTENNVTNAAQSL